jgi:hypothetical protein
MGDPVPATLEPRERQPGKEIAYDHDIDETMLWALITMRA